MVKVQIWGSLRSMTDDCEFVEVEASTFKGVLDALVRVHPALQEQIDAGVSMGIDGVIVRESWFYPVKPDSEVVLMPLMQGG